jgi:hypothetical protein
MSASSPSKASPNMKKFVLPAAARFCMRGAKRCQNS